MHRKRTTMPLEGPTKLNGLTPTLPFQYPLTGRIRTVNPMQTLADVLARLPSLTSNILSTPQYTGVQVGKPTTLTRRFKVALAVSSMKDHMTDEGWQIMQGLEGTGYTLAGHECRHNETDVPLILQHFNPNVVVVQDKREWDVASRDFREHQARFTNIESLRQHPEIFKLTVLKDAHQRPSYHRQSAEEMDCHAWIIYYQPQIVQKVAPYTRSSHLIRTFHSVDPRHVLSYNPIGRSGCLLSGAVSGAYPLRSRLVREQNLLPSTTYLPHPGYHREGCMTPSFLRTLSRYKVALCTSSIYGYALRKIIEATACGCIVVTDLPVEDVLPEIDGNLVRIHPDLPTRSIAKLLTSLYNQYDPEIQKVYAEKAIIRYNFLEIGRRLAQDIENLRLGYS